MSAGRSFRASFSIFLAYFQAFRNCSATMNETTAAFFLFPNYTTLSKSNISSNFLLKDNQPRPSFTSFISLFRLITSLIGTFLNSLVILLFVKHRTLRTPFNLFLVNLAIGNLIHSAINYPLQTFNDWHSTPQTNPVVCIWLRYNMESIPRDITMAHLLVAMNRLWTIMGPQSYRRFHHDQSSLRIPVLICVVQWLFVHAWSVPAVVIDAMDKTTPVELFHCSINVRGMDWWKKASQIVLLNVPVILTLLIYPYILWKVVKTSRAGGVLTVRPDIHVPNRGNSLRQKGFLTLTFLSFSVLICLLPAQIFFTTAVFHLKQPECCPASFFVIGVLFKLTCLADPLLFLLTVEKARRALRNDCHLFCP